MIARIGQCLAACIVALGAAAAPARAAMEPDIVLAEVRKAEQQCREMDGRPHKGPNFLRVQDLNGDGGEDWVLDFAKMDCAGAPHPFCGSGGCSLQIYFWAGGGRWSLVLDELVQAYRFTGSGTARRLRVKLGGSACGRVNAASCDRTYRLERARVVPAR